MTGRRMALIVANDEYDHEGLQQLLAPSADAEALSRVLSDPQIGGFDVRVVLNEPAHDVRGHIEDVLAESRPDDVLLLHLSCHGLKSNSGELFFAARNTRPNRLESTAVSAGFVQRCMRASRSRSIVLLLDCCYGGAFAHGVTVRASGDANVLDSFPGGRLAGGRGRAVITASSAMEYAFEDNVLTDDHQQRPSIFTSAVVEGLATGDADRDEDGWISLDELYDYVFDRVRERNPHQTPSRDVEMQGDLYVARSRRRRIRVRPIPADLDAARTDPNMYSRLGAVAELRSRLTSDDLPVALGAYEALSETARTDVRFVAEPAENALREAEPRISELNVHFGQLTQGSPTPHRVVRVSGPPIARRCVPHASDDWIRVNESLNGWDISLDTSRTGLLQGNVRGKSPTGEVTIAVSAELIPVPPEPTRAPSGEPGNNQVREHSATPPTRTEGPPVWVHSNERAQSLVYSTAAPPAVSLHGRSRSSRRAALLAILWALIPVASASLLLPVPLAYAAHRMRNGKLWGITAIYTCVLIAAWIWALVDMDTEGNSPLAPSFVIVFLPLVAAVHTFRLFRRIYAHPRLPAVS